MTFWKRVLCGFALALIVAVPLYAKVVVSATQTGNQTFQGGNFALQLSNGGPKAISFIGKGVHTISFSAECETSGDWLSIQFYLDFQLIAPTGGTSDAFCSDHNGNDVVDAWTTAHYRVATPSLPDGVHTLQVLASVVGNLQGGGLATGWIGDLSVIVEK
jgi:hypothetical protein